MPDSQSVARADSMTKASATEYMKVLGRDIDINYL